MNAVALSDRLLDFSARVGKVVDALPRERLANHIASELVRCGTAPGSHYEEGCGAESRADFLHKLRLALKELRESGYWLRLGSVWKLLFRRLRELRNSGRTTSSPFAMEGSRIKRHQLTDEPWELVADLFPPPASTGRPPADRRMIVDAILWIMHSGAAWRDLPEDEFCPWKPCTDCSTPGTRTASSTRSSVACRRALSMRARSTTSCGVSMG